MLPAVVRCPCCAGFFEDKDKDAKARGVAPPKKKDPNEEFKTFMESIDADVQDAEDVAAEEAAEEALERDQLDDFEQRYLIRSLHVALAWLRESPTMYRRQFARNNLVGVEQSWLCPMIKAHHVRVLF